MLSNLHKLLCNIALYNVSEYLFLQGPQLTNCVEPKHSSPLLFVSFSQSSAVSLHISLRTVSGQSALAMDGGGEILGEQMVPVDVLHEDESVYFSARCSLFID